MAFEKIIKGIGMKQGLAEGEVSVGKYGISFAKDLRDDFILPRGMHMEVYVDVEGRRVGFKPTNDGATGFKLQQTKRGNKTGNCYIASKTVKRVPEGRYKSSIVGDMIVINVPEIAHVKRA